MIRSCTPRIDEPDISDNWSAPQVTPPLHTPALPRTPIANATLLFLLLGLRGAAKVRGGEGGATSTA